MITSKIHDYVFYALVIISHAYGRTQSYSLALLPSAFTHKRHFILCFSVKQLEEHEKIS